MAFARYCFCMTKNILIIFPEKNLWYLIILIKSIDESIKVSRVSFFIPSFELAILQVSSEWSKIIESKKRKKPSMKYETIFEPYSWWCIGVLWWHKREVQELGEQNYNNFFIAFFGGKKFSPVTISFPVFSSRARRASRAIFPHFWAGILLASSHRGRVFSAIWRVDISARAVKRSSASLIWSRRLWDFPSHLRSLCSHVLIPVHSSWMIFVRMAYSFHSCTSLRDQ